MKIQQLMEATLQEYVDKYLLVFVYYDYTPQEREMFAITDIPPTITNEQYYQLAALSFGKEKAGETEPVNGLTKNVIRREAEKPGVDNIRWIRTEVKPENIMTWKQFVSTVSDKLYVTPSDFDQ